MGNDVVKGCTRNCGGFDSGFSDGFGAIVIGAQQTGRRKPRLLACRDAVEDDFPSAIGNLLHADRTFKHEQKKLRGPFARPKIRIPFAIRVVRLSRESRLAED